MNPIIQSAMYYTLSTVAQTLAGAIGLLGAIVLFSLQSAQRSIERAAKQLSQIPHADLNALYIRHLFTRRSYDELARRYGDLLEGSIETSSELLVYHSTLTWELNHEAAIRRSFWMALLGSGIVISFAMIGLALVPELTLNAAVADTWLGISVAAAIGCLVLFGSLLRVVVHRATAEELARGVP